MRHYIIDKLEHCWSPEQIAGRLKLDSQTLATVCHETIYRYIYGPEGRAAGLYLHLPKARRQRRRRYGRKPRASFIPATRAIAQRPPEVDDRQTFGHWEADLLIFRREHGKANLTSMIERQTRFTILLPNPDRQSNALIGRIGQAWQGLPKGSCRVVTFDRGTEFAAYGLLADQLGTEVYFCDPHSPWQKSVVETTTGGSTGSYQANVTWPSWSRTTLPALWPRSTRHPGAASAIAPPKKPSRISWPPSPGPPNLPADPVALQLETARQS